MLEVLLVSGDIRNLSAVVRHRLELTAQRHMILQLHRNTLCHHFCLHSDASTSLRKAQQCFAGKPWLPLPILRHGIACCTQRVHLAMHQSSCHLRCRCGCGRLDAQPIPCYQASDCGAGSACIQDAADQVPTCQVGPPHPI